MSIVFGSPEAMAIVERDRTIERSQKWQADVIDPSVAYVWIKEQAEEIDYDRLTPEEHAALPAYLVTCPTCGGTMGACTADRAYAKETAKFIAEQIRYGQVINRVTVADVRKAAWCSCDGPVETVRVKR